MRLSADLVRCSLQVAVVCAVASVCVTGVCCIEASQGRARDGGGDASAVGSASASLGEQDPSVAHSGGAGSHFAANEEEEAGKQPDGIAGCDWDGAAESSAVGDVGDDDAGTILFLIGAQKAGTSVVYSAILKTGLVRASDAAYAPDAIAGPAAMRGKELHLFDRVLTSATEDEWRARFTPEGVSGSSARNATVLVDATPDYLSVAVAPGALLSAFAERHGAPLPSPSSIPGPLRFVVLLRDPISRFLSAFRMEYSRWPEICPATYERAEHFLRRTETEGPDGNSVGAVRAALKREIDAQLAEARYCQRRYRRDPLGWWAACQLQEPERRLGACNHVMKGMYAEQLRWWWFHLDAWSGDTDEEREAGDLGPAGLPSWSDVRMRAAIRAAAGRSDDGAHASLMIRTLKEATRAGGLSDVLRFAGVPRGTIEAAGLRDATVAPDQSLFQGLNVPSVLRSVEASDALLDPLRDFFAEDAMRLRQLVGTNAGEEYP